MLNQEDKIIKEKLTFFQENCWDSFQRNVQESEDASVLMTGIDKVMEMFQKDSFDNTKYAYQNLGEAQSSILDMYCIIDLFKEKDDKYIELKAHFNKQYNKKNVDVGWG